MKQTSILSDFLEALGVPHTECYADRRFDTMTFKSLFGLTKVLDDYGVASRAYSVGDKAGDLDKFTPPFLAATADGFVIVESIADGKVGVRGYDGRKTVSSSDFCKAWTGVALVACPGAEASEPNYTKHFFIEQANRGKRWILSAAAIFLFLYLFISNGIYAHASTVLLTLVDLAGLFVTYELLLKSLNIHSDTGDSICSIIDRTGCHTVLSTSASTFFGIFSWSEVGFSYFAVSLAALLIFPQSIGYLALINACCCPFSFWSVWYQKTRAKAWCTLCLITQACLWLSLACYLFGGWFRTSFPLGIEFFVLGATYVAALLGLNAAMPAFDHNEKQD